MKSRIVTRQGYRIEQHLLVQCDCSSSKKMSSREPIKSPTSSPARSLLILYRSLVFSSCSVGKSTSGSSLRSASAPGLVLLVMIPVFPKSSRRAHRGNRRTRNLSDDEPAAAGTNDLEDVDDGGGDLEEIQSSIRLFKEKKDKRAARRAHKESSFKKETPETSKSSSLLSFDDVNEDGKEIE